MNTECVELFVLGSGADIFMCTYVRVCACVCVCVCVCVMVHVKAMPCGGLEVTLHLLLCLQVSIRSLC